MVKIRLLSAQHLTNSHLVLFDEPGISEMFASYFDNLVQSKYVYSIEETITKWEEIVEQIEREIEDRKE